MYMCCGGTHIPQIIPPESGKMAKNKTAARFAVFIATVLMLGGLRAGASGSGDVMIAAGTPLGVKFMTDGVVITGIRPLGGSESSPALDAGLRRGDIIIRIDDKKIDSAKSLCEAVKASEGKPVPLVYSRAGRDMITKISAGTDSDGEYRLGLWVRDSASGIGTVTFINPITLAFAGLGHGIGDPESGALLPMMAGTVEEVSLTGITPGRAGMPGELHGFFTGRKNGIITANSMSGITGVLSSMPDGLEKELYPVGKKTELREGPAHIFATVDGEGRRQYEIEISKIDIGGSQKNFTVTVTDKALLEKTGGIVQGMSGSPIIQSGKLVGAITHVLVSDPSSGYGIFIENMMNPASGTSTSGIAA